VGKQRIETGVLVHHGHVTAPWGPDKLCNLSSEHLAAILETPPEVLLIGTGRTTSFFPHSEILKILESAHIGFECMDTRSAARTYNILITEDRDVSAAMLPPTA